MPWIVVVTLVVFSPLVLISFFNGRALSHSLRAVFGISVRRAMLIVLWSLSYLNLLPILSLGTFLIGGRKALLAFSGESLFIDILLTYPFWISLVISVQLFVLILLFELAKAFVRLFSRYDQEGWKRIKPIYVLGSLGLLTVYSLVIIYFNTWTVTIVKQDVKLPPEFSSLNGITIAHISDVQGDERTTEKRLEAYVDTVRALNPDIVFFSGDLVTGGEKFIASSARILGTLQSKYGTYAAVGDHDIFSNKRMVLANMREHSIVVLDDSTVVVHTDSSSILVTGITITYPQRASWGRIDSLLSPQPNIFKILLVHQPAQSLMQKASEKGYRIALAGHTHGGGIAFGIPGLGYLAPASFESPYLSGMYQEGPLLISVTNGLGFTLAPIRFNAQAQITLLRLKN